MSLPNTISPLETVERLGLTSLILEEKLTIRTPALPRSILPSRVALVGNYLPRKCGIATFTTDLCDAIHAEYGATELLALPVNDTPEGYSYPERVRFELAEDSLASYRQAADCLNFSSIDLVCLQHEYGIFGGPAGSNILELLRRIQMAPYARLSSNRIGQTIGIRGSQAKSRGRHGSCCAPCVEADPCGPK